MGFSLSPGVVVREFDQTLYIQNVSSSIGAMCGSFAWGPVDEITLVDSERSLVEKFGLPDDNNFQDWFSAGNFLLYSDNLKTVRVVDEAVARNAAVGVGATPTATGSDISFANATDTITTAGSADFSVFSAGDIITIGGTTDNDGIYTVTGTPNATEVQVLETGTLTDEAAGSLITVVANLGQAGTGTPILVKNGTHKDSIQTSLNSSGNAFIAKYPGLYGNRLAVHACDLSSWSTYAYANFFNVEPDTDEMYVTVTLDDTVVETFIGSKNPISVSPTTGGSFFIEEIINRTSKYAWLIADSLYSTTAGAGNYTRVDFSANFEGGVDGYDSTDIASGPRQLGWDLFLDGESVEVDLLIAGDASRITSKYIIENIAEVRKDCVAFVSPEFSDVVGVANPVTQIVETRVNDFGSSSYGFMDGNFKYMYDKFNDTFRWVALNGDMAGLCARTDLERDAWWSPAGLNRGHVRGVVKLAFNPSKAQRDDLYKEGVNPIVQFRGEGTVLFGDRTMLKRPSAFDRLNVRRLFIILEKAIARSARYMLFEFNDATTRRRFVNLVTPFLRTVQGRRGIIDFRVVCDETNNTDEVIARNEFIGDIYIKPNRSINFIYLNFVAASSLVTFEEAVLTQEPV